MSKDETGGKQEEGQLSALSALRNRALDRLFPGSIRTPKDASLELVPRILGAEIEYRSRLLEELATMQFMLMTQALRPLKERSPQSLPARVRGVAALITNPL